MDEFKIIYQILEAIRTAPETSFEAKNLCGELFGITDAEFEMIMKILNGSGYISGLKIVKTVGKTQFVCDDVTITISGLEYLKENSVMQKIKRAEEGIIEIIG
jgi:hypothetical protein